MPNIQSAAIGNWSAGASWVGGNPPAAADTWEILDGHTITLDAEINAVSTGIIRSGGQLTVAFAMSTSQFATITVDSGGKLYASRPVTSLLRVAGNINANGTNSIDYGTVADPISNPAVGAFIEFVCTSDSQASRGIVTGITDAVTFCGATRVMSSTLAAVAAIGATTIVLADDMVLRPGTLAGVTAGTVDMIVVGHTPIQTSNGAQNDEIDAYLVANYDSGTKTATLGDAGAGQSYWPRGGVTPNWNTIHQTARQIGTPVWLISMNVGIRGTAYNLRPANGISCSAGYAVSLINCSLWWNSSGVNSGSGHTLTTCTLSGNSFGVSYGSGHTLTTCTLSGNSYGVSAGSGHTLTTCTFSGNSFGVYAGSGHTLTTCTLSGNYFGVIYGSGHTLTTCTLNGNYYGVSYGSGHTLTTCTLSGNSYGVSAGSGHTLTTCTFSGNTQDLYGVPDIRCRNCSFGSAVEHASYNTNERPQWGWAESQDHDQAANAFRAWCRGGVVNSNAGVVPTGKARSYQHIPESASYPVFKQERIAVAAGAVLAVSWWMRKDVVMAYLPRTQIVDAFADPLVVASNPLLAEQQMTDSVDTWESGTLTWQNTGSTPRDVYVRTLAKNASGNFYALTEARTGGAVRISPRVA